MVLPLFYTTNQLPINQIIDPTLTYGNCKVLFPFYFVRLTSQSCHHKILTFVE